VLVDEVHGIRELVVVLPWSTSWSSFTFSKQSLVNLAKFLQSKQAMAVVKCMLSDRERHEEVDIR